MIPTTRTTHLQGGLSDTVRPTWSLEDNIFDVLLGEAKEQAKKTVTDITGEATDTLGKTVKEATMAGLEQTAQQNPKALKSVVATGAIIGLGASAALVGLGVLIGRKKAA